MTSNKQHNTSTTTQGTASPKMLTLKEAVAISGLSPVYVRRAILTGKLASTKIQIADTNVFRHEIKATDFEAWRAHTGTRGRRSDGRAKYSLYGTPEEIAAIQEALKGAEIPAELQKAKTYAKKAKVAVAAEATPEVA